MVCGYIIYEYHTKRCQRRRELLPTESNPEEKCVQRKERVQEECLSWTEVLGQHACKLTLTLFYFSPVQSGSQSLTAIGTDLCFQEHRWHVLSPMESNYEYSYSINALLSHSTMSHMYYDLDFDLAVVSQYK